MALSREEIDRFYPEGFLEKYTKLETQIRGRHLPKAFLVLRYMIDGERHGFQTYGGKGRAPINFQGGFGYDASLRRMVRDGLATYNRGIHHDAALCYGGNPTINWSFLEVTDKGREKYALMKKRYNKSKG